MRLIDADKLKNNIEKWLKPNHEMVDINDIAVSILMEIDEQPTAYDMDKVIEELEYEIFFDHSNDRYDAGFDAGIYKALNTIKRGETNEID